MRINVKQILVCCREGTLTKYPESMYPSFTRVSCAIEFLQGAAAGLRVYLRNNEAGQIDNVIAGIKRDGFVYLERLTKGDTNVEPFHKA